MPYPGSPPGQSRKTDLEKRGIKISDEYAQMRGDLSDNLQAAKTAKQVRDQERGRLLAQKIRRHYKP